MNTGRYVFAQVLSIVNRYEFQKCVERYKGDYRNRGLTCWNQFAQLFFGQLTGRNGLRDICLCLNAHKNSLYHLAYILKKRFVVGTNRFLMPHSPHIFLFARWFSGHVLPGSIFFL